MLHGILFILKIIGILLLAVVGLIFAVMLLVLLVPVRYRLKASVLEKNPDVDVRITWLLHLLSVRVRYHPKGGPFELAVRILGIRLGGRKKSTEDTEGDMKLRDRNGEEDGNEDSDIEFGEEQLLELLEEGLENADSPSEETAEEPQKTRKHRRSLRKKPQNGARRQKQMNHMQNRMRKRNPSIWEKPLNRKRKHLLWPTGSGS